MKTFETHADAVAASDPSLSVCGTYVGDKPVYFLMPADAAEEAVRDAAFTVRNGRPMSTYEKFLLRAAEEVSAA